MPRPSVILAGLVCAFGLAGAVLAQPPAAEFNLDTGRYAEVSDQGFSGGAPQRSGDRYDPDARPIANFQTADTRFDAIMNRIANNPGPHACATADERAYVRDYVASHPQVENAVRANDLTYTCPDVASQQDLLGLD